MAYYACPRCGNVVESAEGANPVCGRCGYGSPNQSSTPAPAAAPRPYGQPAPTPSPYAPSPPGYSAAPGYGVSPPGYGTPPGYGVPAQGAPIRAMGKPRSFGTSLLLVIVTLSIYGWVWAWKTMKEVSLQSGTNHPAIFYWIALGLTISNAIFGTRTYSLFGFAGLVLLLIYYFQSIRSLHEARANVGLDRGMQPGLFIGLVAGGNILSFIAGILLQLRYASLGAEPGAPLTPAQAEQLLSTLGITLLLVIAGAIIQAIGYFQLQRSLNQYWYRIYQQAMQPWPGVSPV